MGVELHIAVDSLGQSLALGERQKSFKRSLFARQRKGEGRVTPLSEQHLVECQTWMVTERWKDLGAGQSVGVEVEVCGG